MAELVTFVLFVGSLTGIQLYRERERIKTDIEGGRLKTGSRKGDKHVILGSVLGAVTGYALVAIAIFALATLIRVMI